MAEQNKAEFVRSLPLTMPAKEVIARAKEKGIKLSPAYVYVIRSKGADGARKGRAAGKRGPRAAGWTAGGAAERKFVALALELGFARAQAILDDVRARIQRFV